MSTSAVSSTVNTSAETPIGWTTMSGANVRLPICKTIEIPSSTAPIIQTRSRRRCITFDPGRPAAARDCTTRTPRAWSRLPTASAKADATASAIPTSGNDDSSMVTSRFPSGA